MVFLLVVGFWYVNVVFWYLVYEWLLYKVQVGVLSGVYGINSFDIYKGVMVEWQMDGLYYWYIVGVFMIYEEVEVFKVKLFRGVFVLVYVVVYVDGWCVDQMCVCRYIIDFLDFKAYMD